MKRFGITAAMLILAGGAMASDTAQDQHSILRAEAAVCDAYESSDANALGNRLAPGFTMTDPKGVVTSRDQNINGVAHREPVYVLFRNHDQMVKVDGDSAVVTGITSQQGHTGGGNKFDGDYPYTANWVRIDGRWKLASMQAGAAPASK